MVLDSCFRDGGFWTRVPLMDQHSVPIPKGSGTGEWETFRKHCGCIRMTELSTVTPTLHFLVGTTPLHTEGQGGKSRPMKNRVLWQVFPYANDITMFVSSQSEIGTIQQVLAKYKQISGTKINLNKSEAEGLEELEGRSNSHPCEEMWYVYFPCDCLPVVCSTIIVFWVFFLFTTMEEGQARGSQTGLYPMWMQDLTSHLTWQKTGISQSLLRDAILKLESTSEAEVCSRLREWFAVLHWIPNNTSKASLIEWPFMTEKSAISVKGVPSDLAWQGTGYLSLQVLSRLVTHS